MPLPFTGGKRVVVSDAAVGMVGVSGMSGRVEMHCMAVVLMYRIGHLVTV